LDRTGPLNGAPAFPIARTLRMSRTHRIFRSDSSPRS